MVLKKEKNFKIHYGDGDFSMVDERVFKLVQEFKEKEDDYKKLPKFLDLTSYIRTYDKKFLEFYSFILINHHLSSAQLFQDLFVLFVLGRKESGTFLEFGATDGIVLSNTYTLEKKFGWQGVLAEPSPEWHDILRKNRPSAKIISDCIYASSGETLDFFVSKEGTHSTLDDYRYSSKGPDNFNRNKDGYHVKVLTKSLNDVFVEFFESKPIDYMSVDTEGSEFTILENFDFGRFGPKVMTIEHNEIPEYQHKIDNLLKSNNYQCAFKGYSQLDGWYIRMH